LQGDIFQLGQYLLQNIAREAWHGRVEDAHASRPRFPSVSASAGPYPGTVIGVSWLRREIEQRLEAKPGSGAAMLMETVGLTSVRISTGAVL